MSTDQPSARVRVPLTAGGDPATRQAVKRLVDKAEQVNGIPIAAFNSSI